MQMNRQLVEAFKAQVIVSVARQINVPDFEFFMHDELYEMIRARNQRIFQKLETFLHVYDSWWTFQEAHQKELESGGLEPENFQANMELMDKRDKSRQELIDELKSQ